MRIQLFTSAAWPIAINRLFNAGRLSAHWHIILTHSDADNPDTTFSLEPEPAQDGSLNALQADLRVMSDELPATFWLACDALAAQAR
jgi:hypothetical protein